MTSRLKERGGSGGKIMASKPSKTLLSGSLKEKASSQKTPLAPSGKEISRPISAGRTSVARLNQAMTASSGKENPRPISAGRPSIARASATTTGKENPRPISVGRASVARTENPLLKQPAVSAATAAAARWSTSLLPRGKFTDLRSDLLPRESSSKERRSFAGFSALDKDLDGKGHLGKNSSGNGVKSLNSVAEVLDDLRSNGCLGAKSVRNVCKVVDAKPKQVGRKAPDVGARPTGSQNGRLKNVSGYNLKTVDGMGVNEVRVLENLSDEVILIEAKQFEENGHETGTVGSDTEEVVHTPAFLTVDVKAFDSSKGNGTSDLVSKSTCEAEGEFCVDYTVNHMVKDCLNLQTAVFDNASSELGNAKADSSNAFLLDVHPRREAVQLGLESVRAEGNIGVDVKDICAPNKYQSKLHEKLALLEGKVQKIALEIKLTKDMLDKNKPGESKLVLSDIQKKICGVEKAVHSLKDGAKSELASSDAGKVGSMQNRHVVSSMAMLTGNSLASIKSSKNEVLEARFFPHKVMSDCLTSFSSGEHDRNCKPTFSKLNGDPNVLNDFINEKPIALEFLDTLNVKKPTSKMFGVNVELNHGVVSKMQLDSTSSVRCGSTSMIGGQLEEVALESNEKLEEFDVLENNPPLIEGLGSEESSINQLYEIGRKISTGGWFVSEGEAILLAHDDNSCSYYDIANDEVKSEYKPPAGLSSNLWGDCWLIRAPGADGCSGRYIVSASAGNALESGFCSWDFYTKDIKAFHIVGEKKNSSAGSSCNTVVAFSARTSLQTSSSLESQSCWYRPCGPLLISTSSRQKVVNAYDIRDGDLVMTWEVHSPVTEMEYSSPLQWRSRGKVVIAEKEAITLWDVNSLNPQPVLSVPCIGKKIYSLHVNNTDAEIGAGVRQRSSSTEVEGNDGVFCTQDSVNVFDFRIPSGVGLKIARHGANALSIFSLRDSIFIGSTEGRLPLKGSPRSQVEHFSLQKGSLITTYVMPEFNSHYHHSSVTQVWGNSNLAIGICGMGMFVFDAFKDEGHSTSSIYKGNTTQVKETIGPDDLYRPTFDYMESRALIISRDRPAFWKYLP